MLFWQLAQSAKSWLQCAWRAAITFSLFLCLTNTNTHTYIPWSYQKGHECVSDRWSKERGNSVQSKPVSLSDPSDPHVNTLPIYFSCRAYVISHVSVKRHFLSHHLLSLHAAGASLIHSPALSVVKGWTSVECISIWFCFWTVQTDQLYQGWKGIKEPEMLKWLKQCTGSEFSMYSH